MQLALEPVLVRMLMHVPMLLHTLYIHMLLVLLMLALLMLVLLLVQVLWARPRLLL